MPREIFSSHRSPQASATIDSVGSMMLSLVLWLIVLSMPGFIIGWIILLVRGTANQMIESGPSISPLAMLFADALLFVLGWIVYPLMAGGIRILFMRFVGDGGYKYKEVFCVSWTAMWPMILVAAFFRPVALLIPPGYAQLALSAPLFLVAWILEGRFTIRSHTIQFAQNTGRAFLTWISIVVFWASFAWLTSLIAGVFA